MDEKIRRNILEQIANFVLLGFFSSQVAAIYWGTKTPGEFGNKWYWVRSAFGLMVLVLWFVFSHKRYKKWGLVLTISSLVLVVFFFLGAMSYAYYSFIFIAGLFILYSLLLSLYLIVCRISHRCAPKIDTFIEDMEFANQVLWLGNIVLGVIATWGDIKARINGSLPDYLLYSGLIVIIVLYSEWINSISKRQKYLTQKKGGKKVTHYDIKLTSGIGFSTPTSQVVQYLKDNPDKVEALKKNPEELEKIVRDAGAQNPAYWGDKQLYRIVALALGAVILISACGAIGLAANGKTTPDVLVALGSGAVGALAGLFAPNQKVGY